tara:strand:- start:107281 stop:108450 length:1170 start_codon:yes stop_codon:yes gene_type:complete
MADDTLLAHKNILVKDGIIKEISGTKTHLIKARHSIDLKGKFIIPSLSDAHVHLPENKDDLEKFLILNLINGVTKLRSMRGDWNHLEWRNEYNSETSVFPKLYLSAPPISQKDDFTSEQLEKYMDKTKDFDFIKILSIKDDILFNQLDSVCKINNISIGGHFPNNVSDDLVFKSNYTSFEHLGGLTELPELTANRLEEIKEHNIFICPTLSWYSIGSGRYSYDELRNQPGMQYIQKEIVDDWIDKTKQYREKIGKTAYEIEVEGELKKLDLKYQVIKKIHGLGIKMLLSPDSSSKYMVSGFGVFGEIELLKNSGLSNFEILEMATRNFATFFNGNYGTIAIGKDADFIVVNDNPLKNSNTLKTIEGVFINKQFLDKDDLNKLSESIIQN